MIATPLTPQTNVMVDPATVTGAAGSAAAVVNLGTPTAPVLKFTIPQGATGPAGSAATVALGAYSTGAPGSNVVISNSGTAEAAVLNFSIPRGDTGTPGAVGPTGPIAITTSATPPASPVEGMVWFDESTLRTYVRYDSAWVEVVSGYNGKDNSLAVGTVTTGAAGSSASATITGSAPSQTLNLAIPRGDTGAQGPQGIVGPVGPANSLAIGTVSTGATGTNASATITGNAPSQTLNLTLPRGEKGDTEYVGNIDGGGAATNFGGTNIISGGTP